MARRHAKHTAPLSAAGRTLLVLFLCAGIAMLGLLAGGEQRRAGARPGDDPMAAYYTAEMPRYPGAQEVPAGRDTELGGSGARMSFFSTEDDPAQVAGFYERFWRSRRLWVRSDVTHVGGVVSAVDERGGRVLQLLLLVRGGRTLAFPSVNRSPLAALQTERVRPPVPLLPRSKVLLSLSSKEGEVTARIVLSVNEAGMAENLAHFRRELAAAGYRPEQREGAPAPPSAEPAQPGEHRVLVHRNAAGDEITVNLTALGGDRVRVHITAVGS